MQVTKQRYDEVRNKIIETLHIRKYKRDVSMEILVELFAMRSLHTGDLIMILEAIPIVRWYIDNKDEIEMLETIP